MAVTAIIIGAGPSGIAMAHKLKHELYFDDFTIYEKMDGVGGTWRANTYPGCGCDVMSHLYSFSFNLNSDWSKELAEQDEILQYMEDTVDKFRLRPHIQTSVECLGAAWNVQKEEWIVKFRDLKTGIVFNRTSTIFISAVGGISIPRDVHFEGMDDFKGEMFHTARVAARRFIQRQESRSHRQWLQCGPSHSSSGERSEVCHSVRSQPAVVPRSAEPGPNRHFTSTEKFLFRYVPFLMRLHRWNIFWSIDRQSFAYRGTDAGVKQRLKEEEIARQYIFGKAPKKYHEILVPDFELGCKRKIADPGYLNALNWDNVELLPEGLQKITETGIVSSSGRFDEYDLIVLATGFKVSQFLTPMEVVGADGNTLEQQWRESRGAQAYLGTFVHNFPNMAILFGPNTFPANNSALYACETQVDYAARTLVKPILDGRSRTIEVKETVENQTTNATQLALRNSVFAGRCSNWYIGEFGRNAASWPGLAISFWFATLFPDWKAFNTSGGKHAWGFGSAWRTFRQTYKYLGAAAVVGLAYTESKTGLLSQASHAAIRVTLQ